MTSAELLMEIEKITDGERFLTVEQSQEVKELPYVYSENCGISGTGKGTLYTVYLMDEDGNKTDDEVCEFVEFY